MPPKPILPLESIDLESVILDRAGIREVNAHRHEMEQIDAIVLMDPERQMIAGWRDVRDDEFWVRGHIPGRPIFPGVLMIEATAQMCSVMYYQVLQPGADHFFGFGGLDAVKFRGSVVPGDRIVFMARSIERRSRRWRFGAQAFVEGRMVFEAEITGMTV